MSAVINLLYPAEVDGQTINKLTMRRPKMADLTVVRHIKQQDLQEKALFANLCEITPATIEELDILDYHQLQDVYTDFLSPQSPTADNSSSNLAVSSAAH